MATRTNWKELYTDLPEKVAQTLREKRVKPEQLVEKTDGEILALGVTDADLETIRAKYPSVIPAPLGGEESLKETKIEKKETLPTGKKPFTGSRAKYPRRLFGRSKRYRGLLKTVSKNNSYSPNDAVGQLVKIAKKDSTVDLHLNTFDTGLRGEVKVPFSTGKTVRVEIFSDKTLTALNKSKMNFDILLATPADMPKLAKYAKILGPKGLMPNPKSGTVTDNPEKRSKELTAGATIAYKTEPKFGIIHVTLGKANQKTDELTANLTTLLKDIGSNKIKSAFLTTSQSPSLRLDLSSL